MTNATGLMEILANSLTGIPNEVNLTKTIVLQLQGRLVGSSIITFNDALQNSLEWATETVIVDLQKAESITAEGINVLLAGLQLAGVLGKCLVFYDMDKATQTALNQEWGRSQQMSFGPWGDIFKGDFQDCLISIDW